MMSYAYFGFPHLGGTYTVFRQLRAGLAGRGIDLRWVGMAPAALEAVKDPDRASELDAGFVVGRAGDDGEGRARALLSALDAGGFDGVFVNVLADRTQTNIARYLPARLRRIMIVHNITPGTYAAARAIRDHVHATVGVSERCRSDLVERFGFRPERTLAIPHAHSAAPSKWERPERASGPLKLLFLGRLEDSSKGIFWLPSILGRLPEAITLSVAGDGPDRRRLEQLLRPFGGRARIMGAVPPDHVGPLVRDHDVLLMPSRFEGFGLSMVEAMAGGCVPVASRIRGVSDTIVEHGVDGFLFPVGDCRQAAEHVMTLVERSDLLARMSAAAIRKVENAFTLDAMAERYASLIQSIGDSPPAIAEPLDIARWSLPPGLRDGWRTALPRPLKNLLRTMRERLASRGTPSVLAGSDARQQIWSSDRRG